MVEASSLSTTPGLTHVTRILELSCRKPSEIARTANLEAQYTAAVGTTESAPIEPMFII